MASLLLATAQTSSAQQSTNMQNSSQSRCTEIAVLGAVRNPIHFEVRAAIRLKEAIARAGGPNERAGNIVRVVHPCDCARCSDEEVKTKGVHEYVLAEVLRERENETPNVIPGDIVLVTETELVYVMGNRRPLTYVVFREGLRVSQAIAMAGETGSDNDLTTIRINRVLPEKGYQQLIALSRKAIEERRAEDVVLQPRDFIVISDEHGRFPSQLSSPTWDPPLIPRDYRVICNMPQFKDLQAGICRLVP